MQNRFYFKSPGVRASADCHDLIVEVPVVDGCLDSSAARIVEDHRWISLAAPEHVRCYAFSVGGGAVEIGDQT
jgi:hypothetical protein